MNTDPSPVSDGEQVFEMACTCVIALVAAIILVALVIDVAVHR